MLYKHCENRNFQDLSSGRVIIYKSGMTNFPVRLAQELFCRCLDYIPAGENLTVYDPLCGGGYLLTVLGFLNPSRISHLIGSDADADAAVLAGDNLSLLTGEGIAKRKERLLSHYREHGSDVYLDAVGSAGRLAEMISGTHIKTCVFTADVLEYDYRRADFKADIVITDVPYGSLVSWKNNNSGIDRMLENIKPVLSDKAVAAVCSDKSQKISYKNYRRLEKQVVGKRKFEILEPVT